MSDLTGRDRMAKNVLASWGGHMVFVLAGFLMPRLIDRHTGQTALGVWDLGWSLVSYLGLAEAGVGSSVNRFVAQYRATGDTAGLGRAVSSAHVIQMASAALVLVLTAAAALALPRLFGSRLADHGDEARWVVALLGTGLAVTMACNAYGGVITGCHRWDIHNAIGAGFYALTVAAMVIALELGGGLRGLAVASCCGTVLTEAARVVLAHRVCPELRVSWRLASLAEGRRVLAYGGKTLLGAVSGALLYQTSNLLVVSTLGAAALAVYSRPQALLRHAQTFIDKFAFVLTPTASCLQAGGQRAELRAMLLRTGRIGAYLAVPIVLFLGVLGDPLLALWMGPRYQLGLVLPILAAGRVFTMAQQPVQNIVAGLDLHGRPGLATLGAAVASLGLGLLALGPLGMGLAGAALAVSIPLALVSGLFVPAYACAHVGLPVRRYFVETLRGPVLMGLPFAACLVASRLAFSAKPLLALAAGAGAGGAVLVPLYWRFVLPSGVRSRLVRTVLRRRPRPAPVRPVLEREAVKVP